MTRRSEDNLAVQQAPETTSPPEAPPITAGPYSYGNPKFLHWGDKTKITIGSFCSIADDVWILGGGNHRTDWVTTFPFRIRFGLPGANQDGHPISKGNILIGSDVWIGQGAMILSGVTIGHGAAVAARAVVTKPVPPYAIVAGNPARVVRKRFADEQIEALLRIQWWNWPIERILRNVDLLSSPDIDRFIEAADKQDS